MQCHFNFWKKNQGTAPISPHYWKVSGFLISAYKNKFTQRLHPCHHTRFAHSSSSHKTKVWPYPIPSEKCPCPAPSNLKNWNNYMIKPGTTILSKGSFPSRSNCSTHHFSANCSISCISNVRCLMSVSMTAEMTTSQNRRSDSPTAALWIMFTCCQAAGIFLIALPRHRTSRILPVKPHVGQTLQKFLKDFLWFPLLTTAGVKHQPGQSPTTRSNFLWEWRSEGLCSWCLWVSHKSQLAGTRQLWEPPWLTWLHLLHSLPTPQSVPEALPAPGMGAQPWDPAGNALGKDPAELTPNTQHKAWHGPGAKWPQNNSLNPGEGPVPNKTFMDVHEGEYGVEPLPWGCPWSKNLPLGMSLG